MNDKFNVRKSHPILLGLLKDAEDRHQKHAGMLNIYQGRRF